jgi:DNA-binding MarR family transcriptional regulator
MDHALQRASKRMEAQIGVTGPQRLVLRIVGRFPGITAGHLARILHMHPSTLTGIVRRLERQGLVARGSDPRDRRRSLLGLTEAGRGIEIGNVGTIEGAVAKALGAASPEKVAAACEVLAAITASLEVTESSTHEGAST